MGGGGFEKSKEQLPCKKVCQDAGVLYTERLHHCKLSHLNRCQDAITQLFTGRQNGHE